MQCASSLAVRCSGPCHSLKYILRTKAVNGEVIAIQRRLTSAMKQRGRRTACKRMVTAPVSLKKGGISDRWYSSNSSRIMKMR